MYNTALSRSWKESFPPPTSPDDPTPPLAVSSADDEDQRSVDITLDAPVNQSTPMTSHKNDVINSSDVYMMDEIDDDCKFAVLQSNFVNLEILFV